MCHFIDAAPPCYRICEWERSQNYRLISSRAANMHSVHKRFSSFGLWLRALVFWYVFGTFLVIAHRRQKHISRDCNWNWVAEILQVDVKRHTSCRTQWTTCSRIKIRRCEWKSVCCLTSSCCCCSGEQWHGKPMVFLCGLQSRTYHCATCIGSLDVRHSLSREMHYAEE